MGLRRVSGLSRQSAVIGGCDAPVVSSSDDVEVSDCSDATVFVTAAANSLTLRNLKRCTVVAAPCAVRVSLDGCSECVISAAAGGAVSAAELAACQLFVAAGSPILVGSGCRDVRIGPYNVVGDGVVTSSALAAWAQAGATADAYCRLDAKTDAAAARIMKPEEVYWRYLPVPQRRNERLALPAAYSLPETARMPPAAEAVLAGARGPRAQRAEMLAQSKFVSWLLQDSKASSLKHVFRPC